MRALDTAATGMKAQEMQLDQIANDMANMNTVGYKQQRTEFKDLMYQTIKDPGGEGGVSQAPVGIQTGAGVAVAAQYSIHEQGPAQVTNGKMDLMINGEGFFQVQTPNGLVAYTRDGSFKTDSQGRVLNTAGFPLLPPIQLPSDTTSVKINPQGMVSVTTSKGQEQQVGQIQIANFINPSGTRKVGGNLFMPTVASGAPIQGNPGDGVLGTVQQGMLEGSNVHPTEAIMSMIKTQRGFETNAKITGVVDQMWSTANNMAK